MPKYVIHFAHPHLDFRIQELKALAELLQVNIDPKEWDMIASAHPFVILTLPNNAVAIAWIKRSFLAKSIFELLDSGPSYANLFETMKANIKKYKEYESSSFRFDLESYQHSRTMAEKVQLFNQFQFLPFSGPINLKHPEIHFTILEVFEKDAQIKEPNQVFFGRKLTESSRRFLTRYSLPQRNYLGTTSMDPEIAFLMAQMALVRRGDLVYDPCVGTASLLVACAHLGAYCMGSDLDGRAIRGVERGKNVFSNYQQYQLQGTILDHWVGPFQQLRFRVPFCQAILTDPPYGIREQQKHHPVHIQHLFDVSFHALVDHGRLVFVWPYMASDAKVVPHDPRFSFIDMCVQPFGKWERRIFVFSKNPVCSESHVQKVEHAVASLQVGSVPRINVDVKTFREAYFKPKVENREK